jgi:hypothetical protein
LAALQALTSGGSQVSIVSPSNFGDTCEQNDADKFAFASYSNGLCIFLAERFHILVQSVSFGCQDYKKWIYRKAVLLAPSELHS